MLHPPPAMLQGSGGGSTVIATQDFSILTSRKANEDHPLAVPLRAGVCRADPGRVADGSQGPGQRIQVRVSAEVAEGADSGCRSSSALLPAEM